MRRLQPPSGDASAWAGASFCVVLFWPSKGEESTGGEEKQEEKTRKGQEVEKEQDEKAKKEQRTAGGDILAVQWPA